MTLGQDMGKLVEEYDKLAEGFRKATGVIAPGKDIPAAMGPPDYGYIRQAFFDYWCKSQELLERAQPFVDKWGYPFLADEINKIINAALSGGGGDDGK
jgi:hypothetical protein